MASRNNQGKWWPPTSGTLASGLIIASAMLLVAMFNGIDGRLEERSDITQNLANEVMQLRVEMVGHIGILREEMRENRAEILREINQTASSLDGDLAEVVKEIRGNRVFLAQDVKYLNTEILRLNKMIAEAFVEFRTGKPLAEMNDK